MAKLLAMLATAAVGVHAAHDETGANAKAGTTIDIVTPDPGNLNVPDSMAAWDTSVMPTGAYTDKNTLAGSTYAPNSKEAKEMARTGYGSGSGSMSSAYFYDPAADIAACTDLGGKPATTGTDKRCFQYQHKMLLWFDFSDPRTCMSIDDAYADQYATATAPATPAPATYAGDNGGVLVMNKVKSTNSLALKLEGGMRCWNRVGDTPHASLDVVGLTNPKMEDMPFTTLSSCLDGSAPTTGTTTLDMCKSCNDKTSVSSFISTAMLLNIGGVKSCHTCYGTLAGKKAGVKMLERAMELRGGQRLDAYDAAMLDQALGGTTAQPVATWCDILVPTTDAPTTESSTTAAPVVVTVQNTTAAPSPSVNNTNTSGGNGSARLLLEDFGVVSSDSESIAAPVAPLADSKRQLLVQEAAQCILRSLDLQAEAAPVRFLQAANGSVANSNDTNTTAAPTASSGNTTAAPITAAPAASETVKAAVANNDPGCGASTSAILATRSPALPGLSCDECAAAYKLAKGLTTAGAEKKIAFHPNTASCFVCGADSTPITAQAPAAGVKATKAHASYFGAVWCETEVFASQTGTSAKNNADAGVAQEMRSDGCTATDFPYMTGPDGTTFNMVKFDGKDDYMRLVDLAQGGGDSVGTFPLGNSGYYGSGASAYRPADHDELLAAGESKGTQAHATATGAPYLDANGVSVGYGLGQTIMVHMQVDAGVDSMASVLELFEPKGTYYTPKMLAHKTDAAGKIAAGSRLGSMWIDMQPTGEATDGNAKKLKAGLTDAWDMDDWTQTLSSVVQVALANKMDIHVDAFSPINGAAKLPADNLFGKVQNTVNTVAKGSIGQKGDGPTYETNAVVMFITFGKSESSLGGVWRQIDYVDAGLTSGPDADTVNCNQPQMTCSTADATVAPAAGSGSTASGNTTVAATSATGSNTTLLRQLASPTDRCATAMNGIPPLHKEKRSLVVGAPMRMLDMDTEYNKCADDCCCEASMGSSGTATCLASNAPKKQKYTETKFFKGTMRALAVWDAMLTKDMMTYYVDAMHTVLASTDAPTTAAAASGNSTNATDGSVTYDITGAKDQQVTCSFEMSGPVSVPVVTGGPALTVVTDLFTDKLFGLDSGTTIFWEQALGTAIDAITSVELAIPEGGYDAATSGFEFSFNDAATSPKTEIKTEDSEIKITMNVDGAFTLKAVSEGTAAEVTEAMKSLTTTGDFSAGLLGYLKPLGYQTEVEGEKQKGFDWSGLKVTAVAGSCTTEAYVAPAAGGGGGAGSKKKSSNAAATAVSKLLLAALAGLAALFAL